MILYELLSKLSHVIARHGFLTRVSLRDYAETTGWSLGKPHIDRGLYMGVSQN